MLGSIKGSPSVGGSTGSTSMPAPPSRCSLSARASAALSTNAPRAVLMSRASGFMRASSRAPIMPRVAGGDGRRTDTTAAVAGNSWGDPPPPHLPPPHGPAGAVGEPADRVGSLVEFAPGPESVDGQSLPGRQMLGESQD